MKFLKTLNAVHSRLDRLGDLPVFSATINRIQQISSSKEADAMALAMAVMKDANLSAKLLKLANSVHLNRGNGRINVISRAVILIGFDEIKNLSVTLKLIECFSKSNPGIDIGHLLMRSFLTASIARELASKAGIDDIEESYTCGLLHGLGEIVVAFTLSETYQQMLALREAGEKSWSRIQIDELGGHFSDIGQDLAQSWGFPKPVVWSMDELTAEDLRGDQRLNYQLASVSQQLLQKIYNRESRDSTDFSTLMGQLAKATGMNQEKLISSLNRAFRTVCDLTEEYGISSKRLIPTLQDSGDEMLDDFNRKLSFYIHSRAEALSDEPDALQPGEKSAPPSRPAEQQVQLQRQLQHLQEISTLVTEHAPLPQVFAKAADAILESSGCTRSGFCLLSRDHQQLAMKIARGAHKEPLTRFFELKRGRQSEFFFRLVEKQSTLLVTDTREAGWSERLPPDFMQQVNPCGFIIAPLAVNNKVVGFLYADRSLEAGPIDDDDFRCFSQFHMQTRMALGYAQGKVG